MKIKNQIKQNWLVLGCFSPIEWWVLIDVN